MKMLRIVMVALSTLLLVFPGWVAAQSVSVLYKKDSALSADRNDSAVQAALLAFEQGLIERGFELIQPDPKTYEVLDKSAQGAIVTFAADAGLSLLVDAIKTTRPNEGTDNAFAEVRLRARLFHGRRILAALSGSGQVGYRLGSEEKAYEVAASRAVRQLVGLVAAKLESGPKVVVEPPMPPVAEPPAGEEGPLVPAQRRWALLVGVSDFANVRKLTPNVGVPDLKGVKGDVALVKKTLLQAGFPEGQIKVLADKGATTAALRSGLQELAAKASPDDLVVFYLASHGMPKQEGISGFGYPVTYDTRLFDKASIIDFEEIQGALNSLPARQVLWVADTCHSGGAAIGLPVVEISSRAVRLLPVTGLSVRAATAGVKDKHLAVLSSAREDQVALEDGENGLFTLKLAEAIKKAQGRETVYGLYKKYLEAQVPERSRQLDPGYSQQPAFARSGKGDAIAF